MAENGYLEQRLIKIRALALLAAGKTPRAVALALSKEGQKVSRQSVERFAKRHSPELTMQADLFAEAITTGELAEKKARLREHELIFRGLGILRRAVLEGRITPEQARAAARLDGLRAAQLDKIALELGELPRRGDPDQGEAVTQQAENVFILRNVPDLKLGGPKKRDYPTSAPPQSGNGSRP